MYRFRLCTFKRKPPDRVHSVDCKSHQDAEHDTDYPEPSERLAVQELFDLGVPDVFVSRVHPVKKTFNKL